MQELKFIFLGSVYYGKILILAKAKKQTNNI